ncbi:MAG: adenosine deaminase, partial [Acidobacteriaceae bacterium]|nr:adenosine deaminase [Acidobacteriaceae bacterium]
EQYEREYMAPQKCTDLAEFLGCAVKGFQLMQTEDSLRLVVEDMFSQLAHDGVIYAELRFAPLLHTAKGLTSERVVQTVETATDQMIRSTGIEARVILCTLRHFDRAQSMQTAELVEKFRGGRVAALDIAGDEAGFPLDPHVSAYRFAMEKGLSRTAHAGEASGPESVWETLRLLQPTRVGHGTRSIEDPLLVTELKRERIHLELCPSSNVQIIPSVETWHEHPIDKLYRAGVALNVNTDTRMLTPTTLTHEYEGMKRVFGWGADELSHTNLMAIDAAFVDEEVKIRLRAKLAAGYHDAPTL